MRLINAKTGQFEEFVRVVPPYAILSHTWGAEEVSFQEFEKQCSTLLVPSSGGVTETESKEGMKKIAGCCRQAMADDIEYVWVDTCCIDKSSSSELQETINSMFEWYSNAVVCYVYLADVPPGDDPLAWSSAFSKSRWFTRGWTLQELLAPVHVVFYDNSWDMIATRQDLELTAKIAEITRIRTIHLNASSAEHYRLRSDDEYDLSVIGVEQHKRYLSHISIAERMSWVSRRSTTRSEDLAYCLLGLFDIHMTMLYGEGHRAFIRLQQKIMKVSNDTSLFAWGYGPPLNQIPWRNPRASEFLASSPLDFQFCHEIKKSSSPLFWVNKARFILTQQGLDGKFLIRPDRNFSRVVYCILACSPVSEGRENWDEPTMIAIPLIRQASFPDDGEDDDQSYIRCSWCKPFRVSMNFFYEASWRKLKILRTDYDSLDRILHCHVLGLRVWGAQPDRFGLISAGMYPPQPFGPGLFSYEEHSAGTMFPTDATEASSRSTGEEHETLGSEVERTGRLFTAVSILGRIFLMVLIYEARWSAPGFPAVLQKLNFELYDLPNSSDSPYFGLETLEKLYHVDPLSSKLIKRSSRSLVPGLPGSGDEYPNMFQVFEVEHGGVRLGATMTAIPNSDRTGRVRSTDWKLELLFIEGSTGS
jgi:hypothetical protein